MKHFVKCLLLITNCTAWNALHAQKTEILHLEPKNVKITSSVFSTVQVADTRFDTVNMGFVQRGALNRHALIKLSQPMADEVTSCIYKLIDSASLQHGTLYINIRKFFLSESDKGLTESGKFAFKAGCYYKMDSIYRQMFTIDTVFLIKSGMDVTESLISAASEQFGLFIKKAATFDITKCDILKTYTAYDIQHIDEYEKKDIPVYNVDLPQKGVYATYDDFKNNRPSQENIIAKYANGIKKPLVYEEKENGKKGKEILHKDYYAVCDGEQLFISTIKTLYPLTKRDGDFYFTGLGKDAASLGNVVLGGLFFGWMGASIAANGNTATFEFKIDQASGKFIPVKKIKD